MYRQDVTLVTRIGQELLHRTHRCIIIVPIIISLYNYVFIFSKFFRRLLAALGRVGDTLSHNTLFVELFGFLGLVPGITGRSSDSHSMDAG